MARLNLPGEFSDPEEKWIEFRVDKSLPPPPSPDDVVARIPEDATPEQATEYREKIFTQFVAPTEQYKHFLASDPASAIRLKNAYLGLPDVQEFFPNFEKVPPPFRDFLAPLRPEVMTPLLQGLQEQSTVQTPEQKQIAETILPPEQRGVMSALAGMAGGAAAYAPAMSLTGVGTEQFLGQGLRYGLRGMTKVIPEMLAFGFQSGLAEVQQERIRLQEQGEQAAVEEYFARHTVSPEGDVIRKPTEPKSPWSAFPGGYKRGVLLDAVFRGAVNFVGAPFLKSTMGVGKGAKKFLGAVWKGRRTVMGDLLAGKIPPPEEVAALQNLIETGPAHLDPLTEAAINRTVKEPIIIHTRTPTRSVEITLRTGRKVFPKDLVRGWYSLPSRALSGKAMAGPEIKFNWADVAKIEGPPEKITQLYKEMGLIGTEFKFAPAVKFMAAEAKARTRGYDLRQIGDKWFVFSNSRLVKEPTMRRALPEEEGPESVNKILDQFFGEARGVEAREPVTGRRAVSEPQALEFGTKAEAEKWLDGQPYRETTIIERGFYETLMDKGTGDNVLTVKRLLSKEDQENLRELAEFFSMEGPPPPGLETINMMPKPEYFPPEQRPDAQIASIVAGKWVSPPDRIAKRLEHETGLPVWSDLFQPIRDGKYTHRIRMEPIRKEFKGVLKGLGKKQGYYFHALMTKSNSPEATLFAVRNNLDVMKVAELRDFMRAKFRQAKIGDADLFFQEYLPNIMRSGGVDAAYPDPTMMPREVAALARAIRNDEIQVWKRPEKMKLGEVLYAMVDRGSWFHEMEPTIQKYGKIWNEKFGDPNIPEQVKKFATQYLSTVTGNPYADKGAKIAIGRAMKRMVNTIRGEFDKPVTPKQAEEAANMIFERMFMLNYSANFGLRAAATVRQFLQTSQTTIPTFGLGYTVEAITRRIGAGTKRLLEAAIGREPSSYSIQMLEKSGVTTEQAFGFTGDRGRLFGKMFSAADRDQRRYAALAQLYRLDDYMDSYLATARTPKDWIKFTRQAALNHYDPLVQARIRNMIEAGDTEGAKIFAMREGAEFTQFLYDAGDQVRLSRGVAGKFFGQYTNYPGYYGEFMRVMFRDGDLVHDRLPMISRWIAANVAVGWALKTVFEADVAEYLFFAPLKMGGGPFWNWGKDVYLWGNAYGSESEQAGERVTRTRDLTLPLVGDFPLPNILLQLTPGQNAMRDIMKASEGGKDFQDVARDLVLGLPELEEEDKEFPYYLMSRSTRRYFRGK